MRRIRIPPKIAERTRRPPLIPPPPDPPIRPEQPAPEAPGTSSEWPDPRLDIAADTSIVCHLPRVAGSARVLNPAIAADT
uniref:Uncharacterized protein n=1 Tax=Arundo donax TaxID=35708 RepID=A0A0A9C4J4_ARUDO